MYIHNQARRLQALREKHSLTTRALAKIIGVSNGVISRWCQGKAYPSRKHTKIICDYFKIEPAWFIYGVSDGDRTQDIDLSKLSTEHKITILQTYNALLDSQKSKGHECKNGE
jgi:transcriptional regulator with XRE-family HTH domain